MAITVWSTFSILLQPLAQACEEPINLCESDDDALPQQPVHQRAPEFVVQMDARKLGAKKRKAEPGQQSHHSAAAGSEARRKDAALPAKQAQRAESRQLGIRDPLPTSALQQQCPSEKPRARGQQSEPPQLTPCCDGACVRI